MYCLSTAWYSLHWSLLTDKMYDTHKNNNNTGEVQKIQERKSQREYITIPDRTDDTDGNNTGIDQYPYRNLLDKNGCDHPRYHAENTNQQLRATGRVHVSFNQIY